MSDNFKFVQAQAFILAGAGAILGDTEVTLSSFEGIDGDLLTMADFGSKGFATLEPNSGTQEEQISFTGVTQNANGTATLTGISNVIFISPYTESSGFSKTHAGGVKLVISNTSGFYNTFANRLDDESIAGVWTFTNPNYPRMDNVFVDPTEPEQLVTKAYADALTFAGAPNASTSVKGIVQEATTGQVNSGTDTGSTGAKLFASPADLAASIYGLQLPSSGQKSALASTTTPSASNKYISQSDFQKNAENTGTTSGSSNTYAFTSSPAIAAYTAGMVFTLKANFTNTSTSTLNVSGLGAITIKKGDGTANIVSGDIVSGMEFTVVYDGTNFQLLSPVGNAPTRQDSYTSGIVTLTNSTTTQNIAHGLGFIPKYIRMTQLGGGSMPTFIGTYNGTLTNTTYVVTSGSSGWAALAGTSTTNFVFSNDGSNAANQLVGTVTFDATNIILSLVRSGAGTAPVVLWEAYT